MKARPITLIIFDGWGYREEPQYNAIYAANKPHWDHYWSTQPHTLISGSGSDVGLPEGQMGNSEVGHLHMGAGRLVPQDLMRIDLDIQNGNFFNNTALNNAVNQVKVNSKKLHIIGLLSSGGVHSHELHIQAMLELAAKKGLTEIYVHAILDGRDTPPRSALVSIAGIEKKIKELNAGRIASLIGRYYAMDRDQRWDRVASAYQLYVQDKANFTAESAAIALELAYERSESDEFVQATTIHTAHEMPIVIADEDAVVMMNFRADRMRELTRAFTDPTFNQFERDKVPELSCFVTLTNYAADIQATVAYPPLTIENSLGKYVSEQGLRQLRIAETEKYAHVTFFFNGGAETPFKGEDRILIPSPKVTTYDLKPEMSARELTDKLVAAISSQSYDLIICNFANSDMVGHSGNIAATIEAIEVLDECLGRIITALKEVGGEAIVTSDHGNSECMFDPITNQPHTAHTENPVPFLYIGRKAHIAHQEGSLIDIAPTLLYLLNLQQPAEMTGRSLIEFIT